MGGVLGVALINFIVLIFTIDSAVVKHKISLVCMDAFKLAQCIISGKAHAAKL